MGKGTAPRPYSVSRKTFEDKWEATFGKRKPKKDAATNTPERESEPEKSKGEV